MTHAKPIVLILCTGNSCRSHLAEGVLRAAAGDLFEVRSAGSKPAGHVHPLAIQVMREIGVDISGHRSKSLAEFLDQPVETVITVCGNADQACPVFPGQVNRHHWPFFDPAKAEGTNEEILLIFRRVRDEIKQVFEAYAAGRRDTAKLEPLNYNPTRKYTGARESSGGGTGVPPVDSGSLPQSAGVPPKSVERATKYL